MRSKIILLVILISVAGHYTSFAQEVNDLGVVAGDSDGKRGLVRICGLEDL